MQETSTNVGIYEGTPRLDGMLERNFILCMLIDLEIQSFSFLDNSDSYANYDNQLHNKKMADQLKMPDI